MTFYEFLWVSEAYLQLGRVEDANQFTERALAHVPGAPRTRPSGRRALWLLGETATHRTPSEVASAEATYRQALALAEDLDMRPLQAHCHPGLGRLYATLGQQEQARVELSAAIALYRSMDMTFWLPQAEAALAQVRITHCTRGRPMTS